MRAAEDDRGWDTDGMLGRWWGGGCHKLQRFDRWSPDHQATLGSPDLG